MPFLGLSGLKLAIVVGAFVVIVVLLATNAVLWSRLEVKDARISDLGDQLTVAAGDAKRWQDKAAGDQAVIDGQAAELTRLAADYRTARSVAAELEAGASQRVAALQSQISKLKELAREHPQDVRDLGPLVRSALPSLRQ